MVKYLLQKNLEDKLFYWQKKVVVHPLFWGKILTYNMCPCKVCAYIHVYLKRAFWISLNARFLSYSMTSLPSWLQIIWSENVQSISGCLHNKSPDVTIKNKRRTKLVCLENKLEYKFTHRQGVKKKVLYKSIYIKSRFVWEIGSWNFDRILLAQVHYKPNPKVVNTCSLWKVLNLKMYSKLLVFLRISVVLKWIWVFWLAPLKRV